MGLLLAFTISGALQRFDDRRQLVLQETTAVTTVYDRLGLFEGDVASELRNRLKDYVHARVDLRSVSHTARFPLVAQDGRLFARAAGTIKNELWNGRDGLSEERLPTSLLIGAASPE
jgi:hypothetical protein